MEANTSQNRKILHLLDDSRQHGVPNWKLSMESLQYNRSIMNLRDAGFRIPPPKRVGTTGTWIYTLKTRKRDIDWKHLRVKA